MWFFYFFGKQVCVHLSPAVPFFEQRGGEGWSDRGPLGFEDSLKPNEMWFEISFFYLIFLKRRQKHTGTLAILKKVWRSIPLLVLRAELIPFPSQKSKSRNKLQIFLALGLKLRYHFTYDDQKASLNRMGSSEFY